MYRAWKHYQVNFGRLHAVSEMESNFFLRHFVFRSNISFGNGLAFTQNYLSKWESQKQNNQFSSWIDEIRKRKAPVWVVVSCWLGRFSIRVCSDKWTFFSSSSVEVFFFFLCCVFVIVVRCEIVWENQHWFELLPSNMYLKLYYLDEKKTTAMVLKKQKENYQQQKQQITSHPMFVAAFLLQTWKLFGLKVNLI